MKRQEDAKNLLEEPPEGLYRGCECVVVELKAALALAPIHWVHISKRSACRLGLLINFDVPVLLRVVRRIIDLTWRPGVLALR